MVLEKLRSKFNKEKIIIIYKLLIDVLFLESVFFLLALLGEALIPGIVTSHVGFSKIILAVGITLILSAYLGNTAGINFKEEKVNKKTAFALIFVLVLFFLVSLIKINIIFNLALSFLVFAAGFYIYKIILEK